MTTTTRLDIKVVFDSRSRGGPGRSYARVGRKHGSALWIVLGGLNVAASCALCYVTWWRVDPFLTGTMLLKTPVQADAQVIADALFPALGQGNNNDAPAVEGEASSTGGPELTGRTAQIIIVGSANGWLILATISSCVLALAGGASLGRAGPGAIRLIGRILAPIAVILFAWGAFSLWSEYGLTYPADKWRLGMGGLIVVSVLAGLAIGHAPRGLARLAGIVLILLAIGSVVGLYLGDQCGAIEFGSTLTTPPTLALVLSQALWGILLFPLASRAGRR